MSVSSTTMVSGETLDPVHQLLARAFPGLSKEDHGVLGVIPTIHRFVSRDTNLVTEGARQTKLRLICSGWAVRSIGLSDSRRQVIGFELPGDLVGLSFDKCANSTNDVRTLTPCEIAEFDLEAFLAVARLQPKIASGLHRYLAWNLCTLGDQVMRLGRMTAYERVCHFLLEIHDRQMPLHEQVEESVDFPITQTVMADALGLSVVHVNRQIMQLRRQGLLSLDRRSFTVHDVDQLREISGYKSRSHCLEDLADT